LFGPALKPLSPEEQIYFAEFQPASAEKYYRTLIRGSFVVDGKKLPVKMAAVGAVSGEKLRVEFLSPGLNLSERRLIVDDQDFIFEDLTSGEKKSGKLTDQDLSEVFGFTITPKLFAALALGEIPRCEQWFRRGANFYSPDCDTQATLMVAAGKPQRLTELLIGSRLKIVLLPQESINKKYVNLQLLIEQLQGALLVRTEVVGQLP